MLTPLMAAFAAIVLTCTAVSAEETPADPGAQSPAAFQRDFNTRRHVGLFIRPDLGFGYQSSSESAGGATATISGFSAIAAVSVGGAVSENLILAAHVFDAVAINPDVSVSGMGSTSTTDTTVSFLGMGPELTYYFMPANIYVSGTLALTRLSVSSHGNTANTNWGAGGRFAVGKEWWVSDHWGLGAKAHVSISANEDPDPGTGRSNTLWTWGLGLAFSATYN
jgi:hypothetical protein